MVMPICQTIRRERALGVGRTFLSATGLRAGTFLSPEQT
jgi:hypothetical protein